MRHDVLRFAAVAMVVLSFGGSAGAEGKKTGYPRVKVEVMLAYKPDAAFEGLRTQLSDAVSKKDAKALFELVAPGFVWTQNNSLAAEYDPGRDAQHNFRVVFGFRAAGSDTDGKVEDGPYWDTLAVFANDGTYYQPPDGGNLVCSPIAASVVNEDVFEQARERLESSDGADWYFIMTKTPVSKAPGDKGPPIATVAQEAVPVLNTHPPDGEPTHYEIMLPSTRTGWIPASAARPLETDRLCYALTAKGDWKIAILDSAQ